MSFFKKLKHKLSPKHLLKTVVHEVEAPIKTAAKIVKHPLSIGRIVGSTISHSALLHDAGPIGKIVRGHRAHPALAQHTDASAVAVVDTAASLTANAGLDPLTPQGQDYTNAIIPTLASAQTQPDLVAKADGIARHHRRQRANGSDPSTFPSPTGLPGDTDSASSSTSNTGNGGASSSGNSGSGSGGGGYSGGGGSDGGGGSSAPDASAAQPEATPIYKNPVVLAGAGAALYFILNR